MIINTFFIQMPAWLQRNGFLLENRQWLKLLIILLVWYVLWRVVRHLLHSLIGRLIRRRGVTVDDKLLRRSIRPVGLLLLTGVFLAGIQWLNFPEDALAVIDRVIKIAAALAVVWLGYRAVDLVAEVLEKRPPSADVKLDALLVPFVRTMLRVLVLVVGLAIIAENFNLKITGLLAGLGIGGIAIALAAQDTLNNFFGSLAVLVERPFKRGDAIKFGDIEGNVEEVGLRSTRLRTPNDSVVTVPNSILSRSSVDNLGARKYRRWRTTLAIPYGTPPEKIESLCAGIRDLARGREFLRQDNFQVYLHEFGPSSLSILMVAFFDAPDYETELQARHNLALDIIRLAGQLGVEFAR
ncbi:MAG TPA: mechanosensitive ion channel domain-containing protein [Blastocatellia bacterium]|nr:mechanosensitive ion channel domain-containing protein [Blastocatellia bacterium]